ncbi:hypothetical protein BDW22DRAFT_1484327 [Trametopsis cervina]|nr:hypothetical protein BDW22DRAFT_1484327 [Trametopsis cervina]
MAIVDLPDDILLQVVLYLSVRDLLSLKQTCRVLHAFGSMDYVWHRITEDSDLLLNIPYDTSVIDLSADELQRLTVDAIRLQANWRSHTPKLTRMVSLPTTSDALFEHLQFTPGGRWLLAIQGRYRRFEGRNYAIVSLWSLDDLKATRCVVQFELAGKYRASDVVLHHEDEAATFAVAVNHDNHDFIEVRTFSLQDDFIHLSQISKSPSASRRIELPPLSRSSHNVSITSLSVSDKAIVASVTILGADGDDFSRVLFTRRDKGPVRWMSSESANPIHPALTRLRGNSIIVFGHSAEGFVCRTYGLPLNVNSDGPVPNTQLSANGSSDSLSEWGPLLSQSTCSQTNLRNLFPDPHTIPLASNRELAFMLTTGSAAHLMQFHLGSERGPLATEYSTVKSFPLLLQQDSSVRLLGVGSSGRRAVWMEYNMETTRSWLMRLEVLRDNQSNGRDARVLKGVLLPPDPPLPFSIDACHSLAFDEATCRLALGLWDGLHIIDFV